MFWEAVNLTLIIAKATVFMLEGSPFEEAWLLLELCAASIALELVRTGSGGGCTRFCAWP